MIFKKRFSALLLTIIPFAFSLFCFSENQTAAQQKTIISFMGAPGSGKGTLARQCVKELKYTSFSTGNFLRIEITQGTPLGKQAECLNEGKPIPDELKTAIIEEWLTKNLSKIDTLILDGFPRTVRQAELFLNLLHTKLNNISFRVIHLIVTDETAARHMADRLVCEKCQDPVAQTLLKDASSPICEICGGQLVKRKDDKKEIALYRLKQHAEHSKLLLDFYKKANIKVNYIDAETKTPQQVFDELKGQLQNSTA